MRQHRYRADTENSECNKVNKTDNKNGVQAENVQIRHEAEGKSEVVEYRMRLDLVDGVNLL
ncbi:MAG: hypothetical protein ACPG5L_12435 [Vibrio gallaecicus]